MAASVVVVVAVAVARRRVAVAVVVVVAVAVAVAVAEMRSLDRRPISDRYDNPGISLDGLDLLTALTTLNLRACNLSSESLHGVDWGELPALRRAEFVVNPMLDEAGRQGGLPVSIQAHPHFK